MYPRFSLLRSEVNKYLLTIIISLLSLPIQGQNQEYSRVKSKYDFHTTTTDGLKKLISDKKYDQALQFVNQSIVESDKAQLYEEVVYLLERKAYVLRRMEKFVEAESIANEAIKKANTYLGKNHILLSKLYFLRGQIAHRQSDFYVASSEFDTAQVIYSKANQYDSAMQESIIDYKYYAYSYAQRNVDTLTKYLEIRYKNTLSKAQSTPRDIIYLLDDFPKLFREKGDFDQAFRYAIKEVIFAHNNYDAIQSKDHVAAYTNLINALYYLKKYPLALKVCDDALTFYENNNQYSQIKEIDNIRALRPLILVGMNKYRESVKSYLQLINKFKYSTSSSEFKFLIQQQVNIANSYLELDQNDEAKHYLTEAIQNIKSTSTLPDKQAESLFSMLGSYYDYNDDPVNSFLSYDSSIRNGIPEYYLDDPLNFPDIKDQKLSFFGLIGLKNKAIAFTNLFEKKYSDSLRILQSSNNYVFETHKILIDRRKELMRSEGKLFLSSNFKDLYQNGLKATYLLSKYGNHQESLSSAIKIFQMSKSLLFLEQAGEFDQINRNIIPKDLKERYYTLNKVLEQLINEFDASFDASNPGDDINKNLNDAILDHNNLLKATKDSIEHLITEYDQTSDSFDVNYVKSPVSKNQVTIEYFVGEDVIYILGRSKNKDVLESVDLTLSLRNSIEKVITTVSNRPELSGSERKSSDFQKNSLLVYEALILPILNQIDFQPTILTIIPDDFLSRLPFEALVSSHNNKLSSWKDLNYLIKSFNINYLLSSNIKPPSNNSIAKKNILGIGYSQNNFKPQGSLAGLPGTAKEIKELESKFEGDYYLGAKGTKQVFLEEAYQFDILHLAVHGEVNENEKYDAQLIFSGDDNILKTQDLYLANLNARLAILSACESGNGKLNKGEGTFSIARGFALVGVPSVVMSLWNINDKVSSELMVSLHDYISQGLSTPEALNKSKLKYLKKSDNYTSHPYYWSSFVSLGESATLKPNDSFILFYSVLIICFLIILIIVFYRHSKKRRKVY